MAGVLVTACNAQVLSLGDGGASDTSTSSLLISAGTPMSSLSDAQANDLCNWLIDVDPNLNKPPRANPGCGLQIAGYAGGPSFGCGNPMIWWPLLTVDECIANLRHSPCHSTVGSFEQCIAGLRQEYNAPSNCSVASPCAAYFADPQCSETLVTNVQYPIGSDQAMDCAGCVPVEPGVTCTVPYSGPIDGGADGGSD
ncbi:MAG TPA: hypothetical protein VF765_34695 [Polyangiaceae bacterium]